MNVKALVGAFNQEKAQVGAFSVIVKLRIIFGNLHFKLHDQAHHLLPQVAVGLVLAGAGGAAGAESLPAVPSFLRPHVGPGTVARCLTEWDQITR